MNPASGAFVCNVENGKEQFQERLNVASVVTQIRGVEHIFREGYRIPGPEVHHSPEIISRDQRPCHFLDECFRDGFIVIHPENA